MDQNQAEISYEAVRQERIKANRERLQKVLDLSKQLKLKLDPAPPRPKRTRKDKEEGKTTAPTRRSSRLESLPPVSYKYDRQIERRNQMVEEEEDDDEEEEDDDGEEDEDGNYTARGRFKSDLCARRSSRLQKVIRINYAESSPKKRSVIEDEAAENGKDEADEAENGKDEAEIGKNVSIEEAPKPDMDTEEHEDGTEFSATSGIPLDDSGEVTSLEHVSVGEGAEISSTFIQT